MTNWEDYFYPGTDVLRNKLDIEDEEELAQAERMVVRLRADEGCPTGDFDLEHLQAIHRHLFQDVYEWAGQLRQVNMFKSEPGEYMPHDRIEMGMHDVHRRIVEADFLRNMDVWEFSDKAAQIIGDTNHAHPFREGNTRTQLQFLQQLGEQAGHNIDLTKIDRDAWNEAKILSGRGSYGEMNDQIRAAIVPTLEKPITPADEIAKSVGVDPASKPPQEELAREELAQLRKAVADRQEKERQELLEKHRAERAEIGHARSMTVEALEKRQASEILEQTERHKDELPRYMREREEAERIMERLEEQRREKTRSLDMKSPGRGR